MTLGCAAHLRRDRSHAAYGHGWAVGEDRLEEALSAMWTANGRRSEIEGERAIEIDRTHRLMRIAEFMEGRIDTHLWCGSGGRYADGINAYMAAGTPNAYPNGRSRCSQALAVGRLVNFWPTLGRVNRERKGTPRLALLDFGIGDEHWNPIDPMVGRSRPIEPRRATRCSRPIHTCPGARVPSV